MAKVRLRNINPLGDIWVAGQVVKAGEVFEVDSELAGRAPSDWKVVDNDAEDRPAEHLTRPVLDDEGNQKVDDQGRPVVEAYDPGSGLLAQTGNYEKAGREPVSSPSSTADKA